MRNFYIAFLFLGFAAAQERYKFCAPRNTISDNTCIQLQRGESQLTCVRVEDSAECAIKLNRGEADFGIFNAEEALLAYQFYPSDAQVIAQLKHRRRINETFEFQTVAVVRNNFTQGNFSDLSQRGLCHPGFSKSQLWNDNVLKYFEKRVFNSSCDSRFSAAENELINLKNSFGTACRPGSWVAELSYDAKLKTKYSELCAACNNPTSCQYNRTDNHGHTGAIDCLLSGQGSVAYVALSYVYQYFGITSAILSSNVSLDSIDSRLNQYSFLCPNATLTPLNSTSPCTWLRQPWSMILVRNESVANLQENLRTWLTADSTSELATQDWIVALNSIIQQVNTVEFLPTPETLATYLSAGRELAPKSQTCGNTIRWCTISNEETSKCKWVSQAAITHGIEPTISCNQANSTFHCFRNIASSTADIITIDSNYGHLARQNFKLSTVLYTETETDKNSVIIAVVREGSTYNVSSFASIKSRGACFPEYGGIAWISFVNAARLNGVIGESYDYNAEVSKLVSGACTPGYGDSDHQTNATAIKLYPNLCSLCPIENNNSSCSANSSNIYYGDRGALECLSSEAGDVAFIEAKNVLEYVNSGLINASQFRVLCRNSSLASRTGFIVDDKCALSVTIDSEVMGRGDRSEVATTDAVLALLKIENWLGYRTGTNRPIHAYGPFNGTKNLLFKDSTTGLETTNSTLKAVMAYKELFAHLEGRTSGAVNVLASLSTILLLLFFQYL